MVEKNEPPFLSFGLDPRDRIEAQFRHPSYISLNLPPRDLFRQAPIGDAVQQEKRENALEILESYLNTPSENLDDLTVQRVSKVMKEFYEELLVLRLGSPVDDSQKSTITKGMEMMGDFREHRQNWLGAVRLARDCYSETYPESSE